MPIKAPISPKRLAGLDPTEIGMELSPGPLAIEGEGIKLLTPELRSALAELFSKIENADTPTLMRIGKSLKSIAAKSYADKEYLRKAFGTIQHELLDRIPDRDMEGNVLKAARRELQAAKHVPTKKGVEVFTLNDGYWRVMNDGRIASTHGTWDEARKAADALRGPSSFTTKVLKALGIAGGAVAGMPRRSEAQVADTYVYSRARNVWGVKDTSGKIREIPESQVPKAKRDAIAQKYQASGGSSGDPTRTTVGVRLGPFSIGKSTMTGQTVTGKAQREKLDREAAEVLAQATELNNLYQNKIKPKIESGQISPTGQGMIYAKRGWARGLHSMAPGLVGQLDPDVEEFITKSGGFATLVNSYYMQTGQGRASALGYKTITMPHVPHPPSGLSEVTGTENDVPQWDLQQQGEQLPKIIDYVNLAQKHRAIKDYEPSANAPAAGPDPSKLKELPGGYRIDPATGKVFAPNTKAPAAAASPDTSLPPPLRIPLMKRSPVPNAFRTLEIPPVIGGG